MKTTFTIGVEGFLKIYDPVTGEIFVDKHNAINYENISEAMALTLSDRGYGFIYQMVFGNGGATIAATGDITYLPPNTTGQNAALYNQTYEKIVDDTLVSNTDPVNNKMTINHVSGKVYTDILVQCLLNEGEPGDQSAVDNGTQTNSEYTFDELGLNAYYGTDTAGEPVTRLLTHVIFNPVQKALNRQIQIDYTIRIQTLTNLVTI